VRSRPRTSSTLPAAALKRSSWSRSSRSAFATTKTPTITTVSASDEPAAAAANHSPLGLIPLNPETYRYYALSTVENSPYAKPPGTAAVDAILDGQKPIMDNIRYVAKKFGLLGLVAVSVTPPRRNRRRDGTGIQRSGKNYLQSSPNRSTAISTKVSSRHSPIKRSSTPASLPKRPAFMS
jgi:hypothetical protein